MTNRKTKSGLSMASSCHVRNHKQIRNDAPVAVLFRGVGGALPPHLEPAGVLGRGFRVVVVMIVHLPSSGSIQTIHLFVVVGRVNRHRARG